MPALKDAKHELFAQQVASGATATKAAQVAGYSEKSARTTGWRLMKDADVVARIADLRNVVTERAIEKAAIDKAAVLNELARIGFANMQDYLTVGEDGLPALNWAGLTRDQAAALVEVTVDENKIGDIPAGKKIKFKLGDKRAALVDIGKELGMFTGDPKPPPDAMKELTNDQLDRLIGRLAGELSAEELAAFGLERTGRTVEGESARPVPSLPEAG